MPPARGTEGYAESAGALAAQYESVSFADVHRDVLHLFPAAPSRVLDIGAGTGRDAAALAALGHRVVAVEPTPELRSLGERIHAGRAIAWADDALPDLRGLHLGGERFDLVLLTAVWMHLDGDERRRSMGRVAGLLRPGGRVAMSLRHGPVPPGRRMFAVTADETGALAREHGLTVVHASERDDMLGRADVRWSCLVLQASAAEVAEASESRLSGASREPI